MSEEVNVKGLKWMVGSTVGYVVAALFNAVLVVVKETYKGVYNWLADVFGHHWIGHGILTIIVFIIATFIGYSAYTGKTATNKLFDKLLWTVVIATLLSVLIIAGFFLAHE